MNNVKLVEQLERLVDSSTLSKVTAALSEMCFLKAQHVAENWQDHGLAGLWESAGKQLEKDADKFRRVLL